MKQSQISARISEGTSIKLDQLTRSRGLRKAFVLEQALQYYFRALEECPEEFFLPPRLVLSGESFQKVLDLIEDPSPPTGSMLTLMGTDANTPAA